jgi:hypothetical protein
MAQNRRLHERLAAVEAAPSSVNLLRSEKMPSAPKSLALSIPRAKSIGSTERKLQPAAAQVVVSAAALNSSPRAYQISITVSSVKTISLS